MDVHPPEPYTDAELVWQGRAHERGLRLMLVAAWAAAIAVGLTLTAVTGDGGWFIAACVSGLCGSALVAWMIRDHRRRLEQRRAELREVVSGVTRYPDAEPPFSEAELRQSYSEHRRALRAAIVGLWVFVPMLVGEAIFAIHDVVGPVAVGLVFSVGGTWVARSDLRALERTFEPRRQELQAFLAKRERPGAPPA